MIRKTVILASILSVLSLPAMAQVVCSERGKFLERLASGYEEAPVAMGLASNGSVVEVLASDGGSWTIIVTTLAGRSCVVASGEAWEDVRSRTSPPKPRRFWGSRPPALDGGGWAVGVGSLVVRASRRGPDSEIRTSDRWIQRWLFHSRARRWASAISCDVMSRASSPRKRRASSLP